MLKNLDYNSTIPSRLFAMLAALDGINLHDNTYFEHYQVGVYRHDGYICNADKFITEKCNNKIINWGPFGVCDNYKQILQHHKDLLNNTNKNYVIILSTIERKNQDPTGGWRWHKWGPYIGTQNPKHEYLYDDTHIDKVYVYTIYEIE